MFILCAVANVVMAQDYYKYRYWFDTSEETQVIETTNTTELKLSIDVSLLTPGFHTLNYQIIDDELGFSGVKSSLFYKPNNYIDGTSYNYEVRIDGEVFSNYSRNDVSNGIIHFDIDAKDLSIGLHSLNLQIESDAGISNFISYFLRISPYEYNNNYTVYYSIDNEFDTKQECLATNNIVHTEIDMGSLSDGMHTISFFMNSSDGTSKSIGSSYFLKTSPIYNYETLKLIYFIDNDFHAKKECEISNGIISTGLDLTDVSEGLHSIFFLISNPNGSYQPLTSSLFMKEPLGGIGINSYEYWINDDTTNKTVKSYDPIVNKATLVNILDLPSYGLRSSNFLFVKEADEPVVYPVNTFNFRANGHSERFSNAASDYVDVTHPIILDIADMPMLFSGKTQKIENLKINDIAWFRFSGAEGDSISLKTNHACTIDVFATDGELITKYKGLESIQPEGFFLDSNGEYYVAVHDITSVDTGNTDLDFYQIGKYAVVDYDVKEVGNGGLTTITFNGNGYFSLNDIILSKKGKSVPCASLTRISNTKIQATYDFGGIEKGNYDLTFNFIDETLTIKKGIKVEDALPIEIEKKMEYDNIFYIGHEPYFNIEVSNKGNNTAYSVPIYIYIETKLSDKMPRISLSGFNIAGLFDEDELSEFSEEDVAKLRTLEKKIGNSLSFMKFKTTNENGDSILINSGYFFVNIPPKSSKKLGISIATQDTLSCYTTIPDEWPTFTSTQDPAKLKRLKSQRRGAGMDYFCCYRERIDCFLNVVATGTDILDMILPSVPNVEIAMTITSCVLSTLQSISTAVSDVFCKEDVEEGEMKLYEKLMAISNCISYGDLIYNCCKKVLSKFGLSDDAFDIWELISKANNYAAMGGTCLEAFTTEKPNCPPTNPDGGKIEPVQSYDPNDILGYVTTTGTRYVGIDQKSLNYTIEFENDSTFATAPAHSITITDILNPSQFDINEVHTSRISIGNQIYDIDKIGEFIKTVDLRPSIDALAEIRLSVNKSTGELKYSLISLDPITVAPTMDLYKGILPVNNANRDGEGFITFDVSLKNNIPDGTLINNEALIIFDSNTPINTPKWTNETDYVRPQSYMTGIDVINKNKITLKFEGVDTRSGIWKYDLYYQLGTNSDWFLIKKDLTDNSYTLDVYDDIDYGFCVVATDMAENTENKDLFREFSYLNGEVSSIKEVQIDEIKKIKGIYDLQGRKIREPLIPGVYIINGEKIRIQ